MKTKIYIAIVLALICAMIFGGIYLNQKSIDTAYNYAITLIQNGSYEGALGELEKANPKLLSREYFIVDSRRGILNECYKNSHPLYAYALAQKEYNSGNGYMNAVNGYLELIPFNYNGELSEEINLFRENFKPEYETFLIEQEKKRKEEFAKEVARYADKLPYEGMSEKYIDYTLMGKHDKFIPDDNNDDFVYNLYYWNANNGDTMLAVTCINGKVDSVSKYYTWAYWTSDGKPKPYGTNSKSGSTKNYKKKSYDDPYDVNEYSSPEDFYDDNYDDFWDYEEAEDYYNSYHEDP